MIATLKDTIENRLMDFFATEVNEIPFPAIRRKAMDTFLESGIPKKTEAYKYTPIHKLFEASGLLNLPSESTIDASVLQRFHIEGLEPYLIVTVNGAFQRALSKLEGLPEGVIVTGFATACQHHTTLVETHFGRYAKSEKDPFIALNTAFSKDGVFVYVPEGVTLDKPVFVLHLFQSEEATLIQPRNLFVAHKNSTLHLIEGRFSVSPSPILSNWVTEIYVAENAQVDHYLIQDAGELDNQINALQAYQDGTSNFSTTTFTLSGNTIRNNLFFLPNSPNCVTDLYGLVLGKNDSHFDNHTFVDHAVPECESNELYKHILSDTATAIFNGKIFVRQNAQKTNAYQSNKSVVLSEKAHVFAKPELEIYADDVKCSHGATYGKLDEEALFYLRSRGISKEQAQKLLLLAFVRDVLDKVQIEPLRLHLDEHIEKRLQ